MLCLKIDFCFSASWRQSVLNFLNTHEQTQTRNFHRARSSCFDNLKVTISYSVQFVITKLYIVARIDPLYLKKYPKTSESEECHNFWPFTSCMWSSRCFSVVIDTGKLSSTKSWLTSFPVGSLGHGVMSSVPCKWSFVFRRKRNEKSIFTRRWRKGCWWHGTSGRGTHTLTFSTHFFQVSYPGKISGETD